MPYQPLTNYFGRCRRGVEGNIVPVVELCGTALMRERAGLSPDDMVCERIQHKRNEHDRFARVRD